MVGRKLVVALGLLALAGCESATAPAPETALAPPARREGVSLADAPVALVSVQGAPEVAGDEFANALGAELVAHDVARADPRKARYLLRVYLSATSAEGGANLEYLADVYDARRLRVGRLADGMGLKGAGDAWSLANAQALEAVAARCAEDLAAFLSNRPEAAGAAMSYAN